jgi:predicted DNA-binding antitoxin AbrB/MazE fold protein
MSLEIEATYENGVLRPSQALPLKDGEKVTVTIHSAGEGRRSLIQWKGSREDLDYLILSQENDPMEAP